MLPTSHFGTLDSEGSLGLSSMALPLPRSEYIQIPAANGNLQYSGGTPPHRQTTPETLGSFVDSLFLRPDILEHS